MSIILPTSATAYNPLRSHNFYFEISDLVNKELLKISIEDFEWYSLNKTVMMTIRLFDDKGNKRTPIEKELFGVGRFWKRHTGTLVLLTEDGTENRKYIFKRMRIVSSSLRLSYVYTNGNDAIKFSYTFKYGSVA